MCTETTTELPLLREKWPLLLAGIVFQVRPLIQYPSVGRACELINFVMASGARFSI